MGTMARREATVAIEGDWQAQLSEHGWVVVEGVGEAERAESLLLALGDLLEQYKGTIRHEVRAQPGFDGLQYSQSRNGITPHTEAPGLPTPPRYLALHCHRQARCGGGQTLLADGYAFVAALEPPLADEARTREIRFDLVENSSAGGRDAIAAPIFTESANGTPAMLRYSYNVMRDNSLDAPTHSDELDLDGIDPFNAEMCRLGVEFMRGEGFGALPGDGDLLIFDNWRMLHARDSYEDPERHLTRYWVG